MLYLTSFLISSLLKVLEIITLRREGLKGQAWIIYNDVQSAIAALQAEQGFTLFNKDLKIEYAREKSDRIAKRDGTFVPKAKRKKITPPPKTTESSNQDEEQDSSDAAKAEQPPSPPTAPSKSEPEEPPSHILFAKELPDECNEMMLAMLFRQYAGFKEVRMPRPGLAFVEYEDEPHATMALKALDGFNLTTKDTLKLTYGKA